MADALNLLVMSLVEVQDADCSTTLAGGLTRAPLDTVGVSPAAWNGQTAVPREKLLSMLFPIASQRRAFSASSSRLLGPYAVSSLR